jgi:5-formyltetrahydrofolate cyclo-ligase
LAGGRRASDHVTLTETKQQLRETVRARRRAAHDAGAAAAAQALVEAFERCVSVPSGAVVAGYWPAGSELDVRPLLAWLQARGHRLVLPVVALRDAPLIFRVWQPGDPVVRGNGACVPVEGAKRLDPDLLLVPLLGFDRSGARLGQGAGYYDRTLPVLRAAKPIRAIGVGYAVQELPSIPTGPYDQRLDAVLTEVGLIEIG